jgi:hypothetical protein
MKQKRMFNVVLPDDESKKSFRDVARMARWLFTSLTGIDEVWDAGDADSQTWAILANVHLSRQPR